MNNYKVNWDAYGNDRNLERHRLLRKYHKQATNIFVNYFKILKTNLSVIDVGCGGGFYLEILRNLGFNSIEGIDVSYPFVEKSKEKGFNVKFKSIYDLNCLNKYDVVICCDILEHLNKLGLALQNILKSLKKNGILYISVPIYDSILERKNRLLNKTTKKEQMQKHDITHINEFSVKSLEKILLKNNFIIDYKNIFFNQIPFLWKISDNIPDMPTFNFFGKFMVCVAKNNLKI